MAQPVAAAGAAGTAGAAHWRGEGVRLGQVLDALAELRRAGERTATRTSVTNLVAVTADEASAARAGRLVHRLGRRHPGRSIVVLPRPGAGPDGLDAAVALHGATSAGHPVWSEDVRLDVRGGAARRLDSLVDPLTLADVPVAVWFADALPAPDDPLLGLADAVIVDGGATGRPALERLAHLAAGHTVVDLCWLRLRPWRRLMAQLVDPPDRRPFLAGARSVAARGDPAGRLLLAGWLAARLGVPPVAVSLAPSPTVAVSLAAEHGDATATFTVEEVPAPSGTGPGTVRATAAGAGPGGGADRLGLPEDPLAWALGEALALAGPDHAYVAALGGAMALAG